ncbi:hypothetical protein AAZX31_11G151300 [Glycine max]|uniref:BRCT domain-containing protein n=1 Tax=Glycine soja TaxID=3848 RepID=A0A445I297_GLYSO|nr:uncharacterized protein LOC100808072 [Glycine max]XP_028188174.1 uncharacterized protein LOC114374700 [Glycine soja]KAG4387044.1 hypothetical protein GLYMA_11G170937v4 [Glycine max]KAG5124372.1 hypothetical protein JHK82_031109 [Glycine max]KAH1115824.1 hypothetical protein GYH30_057113 [Glycine max]RZB80139.1 hypothetical protein D0Y65_030053 [Glycine soja]|eukprot:XP_003538075.2 uncharacterized protein LOC100808072 [Glycine max]
MRESSFMATQSLRPPHFSEDVAWLPSWLQSLGTNGSIEFVKESQAASYQEAKDLGPSQENGNDEKDFNAISREKGRYKSCHLFLSGDDSSPVSVASSPENVFHCSLRLSSDVDSLFCLNQDMNESHDVVEPSEVLSLQPFQPTDFIENMHSMMDPLTCEQDVLATFIPETVEKGASKSLIDTIDSVGQQKEGSEVKDFEGADVSNAVKLSIAASEALVIHDLVKMDSVLETMRTEAVLEVALRVKQARLEGLEDGFQSSNEESNYSDSLSDLDDFIMEDTYEDIGLPIDVPVENNLCSSTIFQVKGVSGAENDSRCNNKHSDGELTSQLANFDDKSKQKQLEANVEREVQQDSPRYSLHCEKEMHSDDPGLGENTLKHFDDNLRISHQCIKYSTDVLAPNQNWATYPDPERFRSRWLGGWTCKELDSSSLNQNNAKWIPKILVRETSFLTESVDIVPDENSFVLKHHPKCSIGSQLSVPSEDSHNKRDEGILQSQDVIRCSSLSLTDPLCSVVPCSLSLEHVNYNTDIDKKNDTKDFVPSISEFEVDNFQSILDKNVKFGCSDEKIMSISDGKDIPITETMMDEQITGKLTRIEHTCLKTYSMIIPNQDFNLKYNLDELPTDQSMGSAASLGTKISQSQSASKHADENKNKEDNQPLVDHKSTLEITDDKSGNELKAADASDISTEPTQNRRSPLILNHRIRRCLQGPMNVANGISVEKIMTQHVVPEAVAQNRQNNNLNKLQLESNNVHSGHVRVRKQVHFSEKVEELHPKRKCSKLESSHKRCSSVRAKRGRVSKSLTTSVPCMKHSLTNYCRSAVNEFIFQGIEFLLTGISSQKERNMEALIRNSGGVVLYDIPSPQNSGGKRNSTLYHFPIILCMRKLQTTKFLYGCAVGASILKVDWITDCVASRTILQPEKYMILPNRKDMKWTRIGTTIHHRNQKDIFERVGILLHGKPSFCTKLACIIKHGGGHVFKTLQGLEWSTDEERTLVGAIVVEDKATISRHLKHCAKERNIPIMPFSWIIKSLYSGKLLPFTEEKNTLSLPFVNVKVSEVPSSSDMSEEI